MGSRYLTDLANVVRGAGISVVEEPGWQTRSRSSGGYDSGYPNHVMAHHTASNPGSDGQADVNYMCYGSENRPVANLYLSRSGQVWVMAAGATNTNGSGRCPHCGTTDNMNTRAIGIEAANNGVGETWPTVQQDVYAKLVNRLCSHYGIANAAVIAHFEYAPDRKIDPAGQSRYASGGNKWNMAAFRQDCAEAGGGGSTPTPPSSGRPKLMYALLLDEIGAHWATNMLQCRYLYDQQRMQIYIDFLRIFGYGTGKTPVKSADVKGGAYGVIVGGVPTAYGTPVIDNWSEVLGIDCQAYAGQGQIRLDQAIQEIRRDAKAAASR